MAELADTSSTMPLAEAIAFLVRAHTVLDSDGAVMAFTRASVPLEDKITYVAAWGAVRRHFPLAQPTSSSAGGPDRR